MSATAIKHAAPEAPRTLAAALVAAQRAARAVEKDGNNRFHGYKYATAEAIMEEARAALNGAGLATITEGWDLLPPTHDGAPERVRVKFLTVHENSDQTKPGEAEYYVIPEKGRPLDKATATALTHAEAYYLRGLLCLPRIDASEDVDQRDDRAKEPPPPRPAQQVQPRQAANDRPMVAMITPSQMKALQASMTDAALTSSDARRDFCSAIVKRPLESSKDLTAEEASRCIEAAVKAAKK